MHRFCDEATYLFHTKGRRGELFIGLLEDDLAIQEMLRLLLQSEGYEVIAYASAEECWLICTENVQIGVSCPALLLIDFHLARSVSGLAIIEQLRANPRLESLSIILMTASTFIDKQELHRLSVPFCPNPLILMRYSGWRRKCFRHDEG